MRPRGGWLGRLPCPTWRQVVPAQALAEPRVIPSHSLPSCRGSGSAPSHLDCPLAGRLRDKLPRQLQLEHGGLCQEALAGGWSEPGCSCMHMGVLGGEQLGLSHSAGRAGAGLDSTDSGQPPGRSSCPGLCASLCSLCSTRAAMVAQGAGRAHGIAGSPWESRLGLSSQLQLKQYKPKKKKKKKRKYLSCSHCK